MSSLYKYHEYYTIIIIDSTMSLSLQNL